MRCRFCKAKRGLFTGLCTLGCVHDPRTFTTREGLEARTRRLCHGLMCSHRSSAATHRAYVGESAYPVCGEHAASAGNALVEEITAVIAQPNLSGIAYHGGVP